MPDIEEYALNEELGALVDLYQIDLTPLGGAVLCFTPSIKDGPANIQFGGITYLALPIKLDEVSWDGKSAPTSPTLTISNTTSVAASLLETYDDLLGMKLIRTRTFERYLDGGAEPDDSQMFPQEIWYFEQVKTQTKDTIIMTMGSILDQRGTMLPKRTVLKSTCVRRYRRWDPDDMVFIIDTTSMACPYVGTNYFDALGNATDAAHDDCGRLVPDCKIRFGSDPLPTSAFPGVAVNRST